ncbi:MAG: fatty acyl-AMP ligase, partial [Archangium sp.]
MYTFSRDGELDEVPLTFRELNERMLAAAARLQGMAGRGARVLLLFPPGLDFIIGFHGVLCAGMIAIPVSPPQANRPEMAYRRMVSTLQDSGARVILTTPELKTLLESLLAELPAGSAPTLLTLERLTPEEGATWKDPDIQPGEVAFLQYTSGSTGTPKGVRVTHANMLHNCALIENRISLSPETRTVSWLPFHHDMGLFVNVLLPVYVGYSALLMSPLTFLEKPQRWLRAVSRFRATFSGGPNFAYDLCTRRLTEEDKAELDLSCWKAALNAAEPLRARTLEQFARSFASCGFQFNAFYPCYGLAEGTLMVCGARVGHPVVRHFDIDALDQHQALARPETAPCTRALVGSGWVAPELAPELAAPGIAIVSPETRRQCGDGVVGEIWVSGQSVADGYWQKPELSQEVFGAHLADTGAGPYLRTGDLGLI